MSRKYSRLVRINGKTFEMANNLKQQRGYKSFDELIGDSLFILKNKDLKIKKIFRELEF